MTPQHSVSDISFPRVAGNEEAISGSPVGLNKVVAQQFRHEIYTDDHTPFHLIAFRFLMGLSICCAVVSFAAYILH